MARPKKDIDETRIIELRRAGKTLQRISEETGVSIPTLSRRIASLRHQQGILTKYRELQALQLTELQYRVLSAISPEKFENASLLDLIRAFAILKKVELATNTQDHKKINGLFASIIELEKG